MPFTVNPTIFRAYDIRGIVDQDLSEQVYATLGRAAGTYFRQRGGRTIVVGHDARLTSPAYAAALIEGLRSTGCAVIDLGMVPTPLMYFAQAYLQADGGAIVSASHNPPEFNGLKLRQAEPTYGGEPLNGEQIQELGRLANSGEFASGAGTYEQRDLSEIYIADVVQRFKLAEPIKVVLDGGNGVAGPLGQRTLEAIGCEVVPLYVEPDGTFPNHHPDPLKEANLQDLIAKVRETGAALGIALDGDGDRLGVVDGAGTIVFADRYLIVLAQHVLAQGAAPIVFDVKCSSVLPEAIEAAGGTPIMSKTGYPNQSATMREVGAPLAGELSGHVLTSLPFHTFDDGTFAGCYLLYALARRGQTLAQALEPYPPLPSLSEGRIPFPEAYKFKVIEHIRAYFEGRYPVIDIDGVRVDFGDGWGLVRASNTEPAITTRFEARTLERAAAIREMMLAQVEAFRQQIATSTPAGTV
ncbi:MAG TPA: phosphomannomutase/phosphoglucomutase [Roseiflexaceae bacterium]|jgi:phosphomannomutase|nr:phosphomannomutase/phosphoglucomutase [Roseiflexaceae bacterium]